MKPERVKIVVYTPFSYADRIREVVGRAGAGKLGKYSFCSFSSKGFGRFRPEDGAQPAIGSIGNFEMVEEERIEFTCDRAILKDVLEIIKREHPYDEIALDVYPLEQW